MNEHFKKQLERYINGDVDSIYDSMTSEPKISKKKHYQHKEKPSSSIPQRQPQQQPPSPLANGLIKNYDADGNGTCVRANCQKTTIG